MEQLENVGYQKVRHKNRFEIYERIYETWECSCTTEDGNTVKINKDNYREYLAKKGIIY